MNNAVLPFTQPDPVECASCGSQRVTTQVQRQEFDWGVGKDARTLSASVPVHTCGDCGFVFTDETGEMARHEAVCRHLGVMSPREVRSIREQYGLTRAEFARLTHIGEASLARWESGALIQSKALDGYLRLVALPENLARLRQQQLSTSHMAPEPRFKVISIAERRKDAASFCLRLAVRV